MKYIIDIDDKPTNGLYKAKDFRTLVFDSVGLSRLTLFDKASFDKKYDNAVYQKGYEQGLKDAWECATELVWKTSVAELRKMGFLREGEHAPAKVFARFTASEAIAKLKENKAEQKKLKIGDEIETQGKRIVVTKIYDMGSFDGFDRNGESRAISALADYHKTGRHFDEVDALLKAIES